MMRRAFIVVVLALLLVPVSLAGPSTNPADYFFYDDMNGGSMAASWGTLDLAGYSITNPYPGGNKSIQVNSSGNVNLDNILSSTNFTSAEYAQPHCMAWGQYDTQAPGTNTESGVLLNAWPTGIFNRNGAASSNNLSIINSTAYKTVGPWFEDVWYNVTVCFTSGYAGSGSTTAIALYNGVNYVNATIDRSPIGIIGLHNRLTSSGISYFGPFRIWNYTQYGTNGPQGVPDANILTVSLSNAVNGSAWPSSVTFSNVTGALTFSYFNITASGFCVSYTGNGTGTNCTAGSGASAYFNVTNTTTITGTQTVTAKTFSAIIQVTGYRLFTNSSVTGLNLTNGAAFNSSASATVSIAALTGSNNLKVDHAGNYSINVTCTGVALSSASCAAVGIYDDIFKINATSALTGAGVSTFTVRVSNDSIGGNVVNASTSNGSAFIPVLQGYAYNFFMVASGYAYANVTRAANASTNAYQFSLLPENSIFLYFFDQTTLDPIFENVTVTFNNGSYSFSNSSNTSEMIASALTPGTWTITADAPSYEPSQYFVTVGAGSSQDLDVYLLNSTLTGETTITIKDADTADVIQNATVTVQIKVGSNWVTFEQQTSDLFGVTFFQLEQGTQYQLIVEAPGYDTKTGLFVRTTSSYIVTLSAQNTQEFTQYGDDFSYAIVPEAVANNLTTFSITTSSPGGALEWFAVVVTLNGSTTTQNVTGSPSGGTASVSLNLSAYNRYPVYATYYVKGVSFTDPLVISRSWVVYGFEEGNYTLSGFMSYYADDGNGFTVTSRGIIATIAAVILGFLLGSIFGTGAAILGAATVFIVAAFYGWIHWSIIAVVVGGLIAAFTLTGRSA